MGKYNPYAASAERSSSTSYNKTFHFGKMKETRPFTFFTTKKDGDYEIAIVPYEITSKKHPMVVKHQAEVGDSDYGFAYVVHRNVGPQKSAVLCPLAMANKPCPICEAAEEAKKKHGFSSDEFKNLKAKTRVLYNVIDMGDTSKGIQVFDESEPLFEKEMRTTAEAKGRRKGKTIIEYGDGKHTVLFAKTTKKIGTNDCADYTSFDFKDVEGGVKLPKNQTPFSFDEYMDLKSYEDLQSMFYGEEDEGEEDEEKPSPSKEERQEEEEEKPRRSPKKDEDDEEEESPKVKCPAGKRYGKDYDRDDDACDSCDEHWKECRKLSKEK